jgi:predicted nucleic acid-binding protein
MTQRESCAGYPRACLWLEDDKRLSKAAEVALEDAENLIFIPSLVLVELEFIGKKRGVTAFLRNNFNFLRESRDVMILDLDEETALEVSTSLNVHDAIIVATALNYARRQSQQIVLVTRDREIERSGLVPVLW